MKYKIKLLEFIFNNGFYYSFSKDKDFSKENMLDTLLYKIHPKQIVFDIELNYTICKVNYGYTTKRGNKKQGYKIFFFEGLNPQIDIKQKLNTYVDNFNILNKHRQPSNVKFLDSEYLGYIKYPK